MPFARLRIVARRFRWILEPLGIFLASRFAVLAAVYITKLLVGASSFGEVLFHWDASWYVRAAEGYDHRIPSGTGNEAQSDLAFFPALPLSIRMISIASGLSIQTSGFIAASVFGAFAAIALWRLTEHVADRDVAKRTVAVVFFFPGAVAFSTIYPEGLFLFASALCLLALLKEDWITAGIFGAIGAATRPNGIILIACCGWMALFAILRNRDWKALIAPAIAPIGVIAFFVFLAARTGNNLAWFDAQSRGWGQQIDFGLNTMRTVFHVIRNPLQDLNINVAVASLIMAVVGTYWLVRWRPPAAFPLFAIYSFGIIGPIIVSHGFSLTARSLMTAFPLLMASAWRLRGIAFLSMLGIFATVMGLFTMMFGGSLLLTP